MTTPPVEVEEHTTSTEAVESLDSPLPVEDATAADDLPLEDDHDPVLPEEPWVYEDSPAVEAPAAEIQNPVSIGIDEEEPMIIVEDDPRVCVGARAIGGRQTARVPTIIRQAATQLKRLEDLWS